MMHFRIAALFGLLLSAAQSADPAVTFNRDIQPIFSDKCYTCHGPDTANRKTKLRFDIESGAKIQLGTKGMAIVPGDPSNSEVYRRVASDNPAVRMPPAYMAREKLTDREIQLIKSWIEQGAKWERHWSLIPPERPATPAHESGWPHNPIDAFVLERLEREGLKHSPEADRRTLIRRVTLDLTGLPPTPGEVQSFLDDSSPDAYEKV